MTRTLVLALLTMLPVVALAGDTRVFVHLEGPDTQVSMPAELADAVVLADLGLDATEAARLSERVSALRDQSVGARAEWNVGSLTVALEQRPDSRLSAEDVRALLDGAACTESTAD